MTTNSLGGQDRDLLERVSGAQVFMEVVATCASCGFSGWPGDFHTEKRRRAQARAESGPDLSRELISAIEEGALERPAALAEVPHEPGGEFANLPAWARLDLAAQAVRLRGGSSERVADLHLQAAWAVRMGYHPVHLPGGISTPEQQEWLWERSSRLVEEAHELGMSNPADVELWIGARMLASAEKLPRRLGCLAAFHGASALRSHGEHEALLQSLPALEACMPASDWAEKQISIRASVELERSYQRLARDGYLAALQDGSVTAERAGVTTYLVGELERRIGEPDSAHRRYDSALALADSTGLGTWILQQRCLLFNDDAIEGLLSCYLPRPGPAEAQPPAVEEPAGEESPRSEEPELPGGSD